MSHLALCWWLWGAGGPALSEWLTGWCSAGPVSTLPSCLNTQRKIYFYPFSSYLKELLAQNMTKKSISICIRDPCTMIQHQWSLFDLVSPVFPPRAVGAPTVWGMQCKECRNTPEKVAGGQSDKASKGENNMKERWGKRKRELKKEGFILF